MTQHETSLIQDPDLRAAVDALSAFITIPRDGADGGRAEAANQVLGELIGKLTTLGA
jgi:hypothetical protein